MEPTNEAKFEDALESAVDEAVSEVDSIEGDEEFIPEDATEDEPLESEAEAEDVVEEVAEAAEDKEVEEAQSIVDWNGNPDELPSDIEHDGQRYDLTKTYKAMQAGFTKKMQEVAEARKHYEEMTQQYSQNLKNQQEAMAANEDPRPNNPTTDMSEEQQQQRFDEINQWTTRKVVRNMLAEGEIPNPDKFNQQVEDREMQIAVQGREAMLHSQEGWSADIENEMISIAGENQHWSASLKTDEGALAFFEFVKQKQDAAGVRKQAAALENTKIKRDADASKRSTPKPSAKKKASETFAENFADLDPFDRIGAIVDQSFGV